MQLDLKGKIKEKKLAYRNTLLPLFEAIVNSIQAIEESTASTQGEITIEVIRSRQQELEMYPKPQTTIIGFTIQDNGVGFNDANYSSFNYAHSTYKENKGGKGIGRFVWLRAFGKVKIESTYQEDEAWKVRKFDFVLSKTGLENHTLTTLQTPKTKGTIVKLIGLKEEYQKWCTQSTEEIAFKIIEHCFVYFLEKNCPTLTIVDGKKSIVANSMFEEFTNNQVKKKKLKIRKQQFELNLVKIYSSKLDNKIHFCAHTREVTNDKLSSLIPELETFLKDKDNSGYSIAAYVTGRYLDENVNEERTSIHFAKNKEATLTFPNEISKEELSEKVAKVILQKFREPIEEISKIRYKRIEDFIQNHPRYRTLMKYRPNELKKINTKLSEEKLEIEVFKLQQGLDLELKLEVKEALKFIDSAEDKVTFEKKYKNLYEKIITIGNTKLSEYIIHRKLVLNLLKKHLIPNKNKKFSKEETVHKLIFPLKKLSDEVSYEDHNLWIIDEKLAYHKYLASDKQFKKIKPLKSESKERPDIIIFNRPFAFANDDKPYESIVLIEFKRPMREDYSDGENPIYQVNRYAEEILAGEAKDKHNREFDLRKNTPIYAYIICDLTKKLKSFAKNYGYIPLPDGQGYFSFNANYNMYIEIISFDKLVKDAQDRNKILFEKLSMD